MEIRPTQTSASAGVSALRVLPVLLVIPVVLSLRQAGNGTFSWWPTLLIGGLTLVACAWAFAWYRLSRLGMTSGTYYRRTAVGRRRQHPLTAISTFQLVTLLWPSGLRFRMLLAIGPEGECIDAVSAASSYSREDIRRLAETGGKPLVGSWEQVLTVEQFRAAFPGSLSGMTLKFFTLASAWRARRVGYVIVVLLAVGAAIYVFATTPPSPVPGR